MFENMLAFLKDMLENFTNKVLFSNMIKSKRTKLCLIIVINLHLPYSGSCDSKRKTLYEHKNVCEFEISLNYFPDKCPK